MSIAFNADERSNQLKRAVYIDDIRNPFPTMWVVFFYASLLDFGSSSESTVYYRGIEWTAFSYRRELQEGGYIYSFLGYPKLIFRKVTSKACSSLSALCSAVGTALSSRSLDYKFIVPTMGQYFGVLLNRYRYQSFEQAYNSVLSPVFIYYNSRYVYCNTFASLDNQSVLNFSLKYPSSKMFTSALVDDTRRSQFISAQIPKIKGYRDYVSSMFGNKIEIKCTEYVDIAKPYNFSVGQKDIDSNKHLICLRQKFDSMQQPLPYTLTFGKYLGVS
jgi:hypothetical protein